MLYSSRYTRVFVLSAGYDGFMVFLLKEVFVMLVWCISLVGCD